MRSGSPAGRAPFRNGDAFARSAKLLHYQNYWFSCFKPHSALGIHRYHGLRAKEDASPEDDDHNELCCGLFVFCSEGVVVSMGTRCAFQRQLSPKLPRGWGGAGIATAQHTGGSQLRPFGGAQGSGPLRTSNTNLSLSTTAVCIVIGRCSVPSPNPGILVAVSVGEGGG